MSITQYAVCHLQKGSGSDSGMSCHIERRDSKGQIYVPSNADAERTHLNRELVQFPDGVTCRTEAIDHRVRTAGIKRKVSNNQVKAIRIILTGTHERMTEIEREGNLDKWIEANLKWLRDTFGDDNLVSCVLHMDEKTPHLHATVVPIVLTERKRRDREGNRKYDTKVSPRLCCDEVMSRWNLRKYQDTYAAAMKPFGLERGIVGSTAKHQSNQKFYRDEIQSLEENIARLEAEAEAAKEGRSTILSWFGRGELAETKKKLSDKEKEMKKQKQVSDEHISDLNDEIDRLKNERDELKREKEIELAKMRGSYLREIDEAIKKGEEAEFQAREKYRGKEAKLRGQITDAEAKTKALEAQLEAQNRLIEELDRKANPHKYNLSSGAKLLRYFIPNNLNPSLHIWTKAGNEEYDTIKFGIDYGLARAFADGKITKYELVNAVFPPEEQVNEAQASILGITIETLSGGPANPHVGTGSGGETGTGLRWDGKRPEDFKSGGSRRRR